jgi:hypothetical protein
MATGALPFSLSFCTTSVHLVAAFHSAVAMAHLPDYSGSGYVSGTQFFIYKFDRTQVTRVCNQHELAVSLSGCHFVHR